eukprot:1438128-Rhodomonas_salina.1
MLRRCANVTAATAANYARKATGAGTLTASSHARTVAPQLVHSWVAAALQAPVACNRGPMRNMSSTPGMVDVDADRAPLNVTERCAKVRLCRLLAADVRPLTSVSAATNVAQRIHKVVKENGGFLRLRVDGGGCSGFQYKFIVDSEPEEDDITIER